MSYRRTMCPSLFRTCCLTIPLLSGLDSFVSSDEVCYLYLSRKGETCHLRYPRAYSFKPVVLHMGL